MAKITTSSTRASRLRQRSLERREAERVRLRDDLLAVAERLLQENGYTGFSLRQVAEATGYTPTTIYRYFDDRDALLKTVISKWFSTFARLLDEAYRSASTPRDRLMAMAAAYLRFAVEQPAMYRVMFLERMDIGVLPTGGSFEQDPSFKVLMRAATELRDAGGTGTCDPMTAAMTIWSGIHGVAALAVCSGMLDGIGAERLGMLVAANALSGLAVQ